MRNLRLLGKATVHLAKAGYFYSRHLYLRTRYQLR